MKKSYLILILFLFCSCGESSLDSNFDNVSTTLNNGNGGSSPNPGLVINPPTLSGTINISADDGSALGFPTSIWTLATAGTNAIDFYEISVAVDEGSGTCDENDFLGVLTLGWTKVPSASDFSGIGYKVNDTDLDGDGGAISVSWDSNIDYCLAARVRDINGLISSTIFSSSIFDFQYTSCKEKFDHTVAPSDGVETIDVDGNGVKPAFDVYCDMTTNGGGWTLLLNQNPIVGNLFSSSTDAQNFNEADPTSNRYSIIDKTADFLRVGTYEFYQSWPGTVCAATPHHWTQTSIPHLNAGVTGYVSISTPTNQGAGGFNGLCQSASPGNALIASNCGNSNWWYAVGALGIFGSGTPGCSSAVEHVQLWVR